MIYLMILFGKIIEVTLMTVRVVLITKGERTVGAIVGFFEVILWMLIVSNVITGITENPLKVVMYALGFAIGNYTGSLLESYIGLGTAQIQIIAKEDNAETIRQALYDMGFACTAVKGQGKNYNHKILYVIASRKQIVNIIECAESIQDDAFITVHETKSYLGGYGLKK